MRQPEPADVPIFLLCGGLGSRLGDVAAIRPKPMVDIGDKPMLLHIMAWYARFGFRRFIVCTGHRHDVISGYFANFATLMSDYTVGLATRSIQYHLTEPIPDWKVTVAFTGGATMTGGRIARAAARYLDDAEHFGVTYGDGLTDADLGDEFRFHLDHDRCGTPCSACSRPRATAAWRCTRTAAPASSRSPSAPTTPSTAASSAGFAKLVL
jgi:glucose-1-phosphate cytidylyltransferase